MVLELHVWGPAFGLASLDPECLATIAYFTQSLGKSEWRLVQSSLSAVPTHTLPSLHNPTTNPPTWTAGFTAITTHLRTTTPPPTFHDPDDDAARPNPLPRLARADSAAHAAHLRLHAAPLLALSLYVSPPNWAAGARPALAAALPFPLSWTEAGRVRAAWVAAAERAGVAGLDSEREREEREAREREEEGARERAGWVRVPRTTGAGKEGVGGGKAGGGESRLEGVAAEVLDVLEGLRAGKRWLLTEDSGPTSLDCLAFGYLALMLVPDLPRPWLRDTMRRRYGPLCSFVEDVRSTCFGPAATAVAALPWSQAPAHDSVVNVGLRFARGAVQGIPVVGEEWQRWWDGRGQNMGEGSAADLFVAAGGVLAAAALAAGFIFRKDIPALGSPIQRWERPQAGLRGFGAAGAMFGFMSDGGVVDGQGPVGGFGGDGLEVASGGSFPAGPPGAEGRALPGEIEVDVGVSTGGGD